VFEAFRSAYRAPAARGHPTDRTAYRENGELAPQQPYGASHRVRISLAVRRPRHRRPLSSRCRIALDVPALRREFPRPVETALETRFKIAEIHKAAHDESLYQEELAAIVRIDAGAGPERTARTRTLAARSALVLAEELYREFVAVKLLQPFEISLQEKNQRMDAAIEAMGRLVEYEIADVTAAATYYMADTYLEFSRALAESERPADLQPADLEEYELALEEEAFPFEEQAIDLHEKNLELLQAGVLNAWTEKSLGKLVELMPGRYARNEMSSGFLSVIDS
jgi:hypothetical protein